MSQGRGALADARLGGGEGTLRVGHGDVSGLGRDGQAGRERRKEGGERLRGELLLCLFAVRRTICSVAYFGKDVQWTS